MNSGWLVAFEGLDGSGKSTQVERFAQACRAAARDVVVTREPTDGPIGRRIRAMARSGERVPVQDELEWFLEDRRAHVAELIRPSLQAGALVTTDRYFLSTVAYQGARGLDPDQLLAQSEAEFPLPDLALLLEIEPEEGLRRTGARRRAAEPGFEETTFLRRVDQVFQKLDRPYLVRVDARPPRDAVHRAIMEVIRTRLALP